MSHEYLTRLSWDSTPQGDWLARSPKFLSRSFLIQTLDDGRRQLLKNDRDGSGWVLLTTYGDPFDAQDAASYYDFWGRLPNYIPRSET
jgi:hypothetical protein